MPTTPQYREQLQTQGSSPSLQQAPQVATGIGSSMARLAGSAAQSVTSMVGAGVQQYQANKEQALQRKTAQEGQDALKASITEENQWNDRFAKMQQDAPEDGAGIVDQLDEEFATYNDKSLEQYQTEGGRNRREILNAQTHQALRNLAMAWQAKKASDYSANRTEQAIGDASIIVSRDDSRFSETTAKLVTLVDELPGLDRATRTEYKRENVSKLALATAQGIIDRNPARAIVQADNPTESWAQNLSAPQLAAVKNKASVALVDAQVSDIASAVMKSYDKNVFAGGKALAAVDTLGLADETKTKVQKEVQGRVNLLREGRRQSYVQDIAKLHSDIATGSPPDNAESQALGLYARGAMTEESYSSTLAAIERARIERGAAGVDLQMGIDAIKNGTPLDPKDGAARKAIDAAFKNVSAQVPRGSPEWQNAAMEVSRKTNIVPSDSISWARTVITSGDVQGSANAAWFLRNLTKANPQAFKYVEDEKLMSYAEVVSSAIEAGAPPPAAVALGKSNVYDTTPAMRQALTEQYDKATKIKGTSSWLRGADELQSRLNADDRFDPTWLSSAPTAPMAMQVEYEAAKQRFYITSGGNMEAATNLAWGAVSSKWGRDEINGKAELMAYSPSAMFPQLPHAIIKDDMAEAAKALNVDPAGVQLVQSPETASTGGARWYLGHVGKYGDMEVLTDATGKPHEYSLPLNSKAVEDSAKRLKAEELQKAREYSAQQRKHNDELMLRMKSANGRDAEAAALGWLHRPKIAPGVKDAAR